MTPTRADARRRPASPTCLLVNKNAGQRLCKQDLLITEKGSP
jgi:hypothetical protein